MPFSDLLNLKGDLYAQGAAGPVPTWSAVDGADALPCRIQPLRGGTGTLGEEASATDKAWFEYTHKSKLRSGRALKVTQEKVDGSWLALEDGDEYLLLSRPEDEAGAHHHLRVMLAYLAPGTVVTG